MRCMKATQSLLFASVALVFGCDAVLKSPDAQYDDIHLAAYLKSPMPADGAHFGNNLAMDDKTLVVSSPAEEGASASGETLAEAGAFYVYDLTRRGTAPLRITMPFAHATDGTFPETRWPPHDLSNPRWEVSVPVMSPDWIAVGLPGEEGALAPSDEVSVEEAEADDGASDAGAVYVYRRSDLKAPPHYIKAPNAGEGDLFGFALSISGDWLAVGAPAQDGGDPDDSADTSAPMSGAVYLYRYDAERNEFVFRQYVKAPRIHTEDAFGTAVSIEGDLLAVGATLEDGGGTGVDADIDDRSSKNEGAVYTFVRNGEHWDFDSYLKAGQADLGAAFGATVRLHEGQILVGEPFGFRCPGGERVFLLGVVYVIERKNGEWVETQCLNPPGRDQGSSLFGYSIATYRDQLVVGAVWEPSPKQPGGAFAFLRNEDGIWEERASLSAPNADGLDAFGTSVGVNSRMFAIGASGESGAQSGADADLTNNDAPKSGAAYLFAMQ
jgi:hypothetical protein